MSKVNQQVEFTLPVTSMMENGLDYAKVSVSREDYLFWKKHSEYVDKHGLYCIEISDYRCEFFEDTSGEDEGEPILTPLTKSVFTQDTSRVVILADGVNFTGYEKNCGPDTEWNTDPIYLNDLAEVFGET